MRFIRKNMEQKSKVIFDKNVAEFVTVAAEYCLFMENVGDKKRDQFIDTLLKVLPLLYVKAALLPEVMPMSYEDLETCVTEEDYAVISQRISKLMADMDDYLDVFVEDMKYSDAPVRKCISEDLTDIYQDLKNFIFSFKTGINDTMNDALALCQEHFKEYWGQVLVNTMRPLHQIKYNSTDENDGD